MVVETKIKKVSSGLFEGKKEITVLNGSTERAKMHAQLLVSDKKSSINLNGGRIVKIRVSEYTQGTIGKTLYHFDQYEMKRADGDKERKFVDELIRKYN